MSKQHAKPWPRLSETLALFSAACRHPDFCQSCGGHLVLSRTLWQEHDEDDRPEPIVIALCEPCADKLIEPHPRLYRQLDKWEPWPGAMPICIQCSFRDGLRCTHADAKANGGPGIGLTTPLPTVAFVDYCDKAGRRRGSRQTMYHGPVKACAGRVEATPPAGVTQP